MKTETERVPAADEGRIEAQVRPALVECKEIRKGVDYFLTGDFWPHANLRVRLKRWFLAKDEWTGLRGKGAIVESDNGMVFAIYPRGAVFAAPMTATRGPNTKISGEVR